MRVLDVLPQARRRLEIIDSRARITDAARMMSKPGADLLVVCDDGVMVGVITKTDIVAHAGRSPALIVGSPVASIMTSDVAYCEAGDPLKDVWSKMRKRRVQRIPVIDEKRNPVGVIYARDALACLLSEAEGEDKTLRDYISGAGYR